MENNPSSNQAPPTTIIIHKKKHNWLAIMLVIVLGGLALGIQYGLMQGRYDKLYKDSQDTLQGLTKAEIQVPTDAVKVADCVPEHGAQYVLSKDIPLGPIYNVWNGKVVAVEYMLGRDKIIDSSNWNNLPLFKGEYDHIDIGPVTHGHAGFSQPHYHFDFFLISSSEKKNITCPATSGDPQMDSMEMAPEASPSASIKASPSASASAKISPKPSESVMEMPR